MRAETRVGCRVRCYCKAVAVPERAAAGRKGFGLTVSVGSIPSFVTEELLPGRQEAE